jgi:NACalpha-BTF3-like transcription factor
MTEQNIEQIVNILLKYQHKLSDGYQYYVYEDTVSNVLREIAQSILTAINSEEPEIHEKDIELVAYQANVSRERATEALKKNKGDIVDAIMWLSP